jgi:2-keto-4-pentenoate hydratase/2-oxohepta-3-ene-1,7-dioic acid hydratase in catechol pathway
MKLLRFGPFREERPGVEIAPGVRKDCSDYFDDFDRDFFLADGLQQLRSVLDSQSASLPEIPQDCRLGAPIARPGKVLCIGLNYSDHAAESGMEIPTEPILFMKGSNTVVGPYDAIEIPRRSEKTDWEVELGVVLGRDACARQPSR